MCPELMIDGWKKENVTFVETVKSKLKYTCEGEQILKKPLGER